jgi:hypothetical protein
MSKYALRTPTKLLLGLAGRFAAVALAAIRLLDDLSATATALV